MAVQFLLGKAGLNHFQKIASLLKDGMKQEPTHQFFYLVPNHIKFESELETLKAINENNQTVYAQEKLQVFSFTRLVWYFLNNTEEYQQPILSDSAINIIIYQILRDREEDLTIYRGEINQTGFIQQLTSQIKEIQAGKIESNDLKKLINDSQLNLNSEVINKLNDLAIIYEEFNQRVSDDYLYHADTLKLLANYLNENDLSQMNFYISGFSQFSAQELEIVQILIEKANYILIDFDLDQKYPNQLPENPNLFWRSANLYYQLYNYAKNQNVKIMVDQFVDQSDQSETMQALEDFFIQNTAMKKDIQKSELKQPAIDVMEANSTYMELQIVTNQIKQMVATGNYRYSDFILITKDLNQYRNIIQPIFEMQQIPHFEDIQKTMDSHPLVEFIDALFSIDRGSNKRNYRYQDVMRLLKTELLVPKIDQDTFMEINEFRDDLAITENYVLKNGYEGSRWTQKDDWQYLFVADNTTGILTDKNREMSAKINVIKHLIQEKLPSFFKKINHAKTIQEAITLLYQFLIENGIVERLKIWQQHSLDHNRLQEADQSEQVWNTFCSLLDDFVEFIGDKPFIQDDFLNLLKAGFSGASYSQIPSTIDQVAISETGMVQMRDKKMVFMIGSNDDNMPGTVENTSLLNDIDREQITPGLSEDQFLNDNSELQMANEPFMNYLAFMNAKEKIVFSYSKGGDTEQNKQISPYVKAIMHHFSLEKVEVKDNPKVENSNEYLGSKRITLSNLVKIALDSKTRSIPLGAFWSNVYQKLVNDVNYYQLTNKLLGGLNYKNEPEALNQEIVTELYGNELNTSISRLEEFYSNPYEYFLKYGLKLKERDVFELSAASTGQFFHESLDLILKTVRKRNQRLEDFNEQQIKNLVNEVNQQILMNDENMQYEILKSSKRMSYISNQLLKTIQRMTKTLGEQFKRTKMQPIQTEVTFGNVGGKNGDLKPLEFQLDTGQVVKVRGRIDRIDELATDDTNYLGIVDYKSGQKSIDLAKAYDGIAMQMMTYLDALKINLDELSTSQKAKLAGALYLQISNPILKDDGKNNYFDPEQIEKAVIKEQKYNGLLVNDQEFLDSLFSDHTDEVYPLQKKKDGDLSKQSAKSVILPDDLDRLLEHTEKKIKEAGERIYAGEIKLAPMKYKQETALQFSEYKSVMQFDPMLTENNYREVEAYDQQKVLDLLREEGNQ
ncbi:ATP-dependent helicase [Lactobacillus sp. S2-2]|uniref:PD-(D/E)XK nuclease family protein n=1 Tax=Lactobacillus sp. S2-2 TaxID=2692917 RepID=UPI001F2FE5DD|nr:PD-(D/E)XK nuclease family protein [Lactobacillus sp. S2-2]MCF6515411.1 ATP-dependent helicase [Lactobacillus sp. S2-2]